MALIPTKNRSGVGVGRDVYDGAELVDVAGEGGAAVGAGCALVGPPGPFVPAGGGAVPPFACGDRESVTPGEAGDDDRLPTPVEPHAKDISPTTKRHASLCPLTSTTAALTAGAMSHLAISGCRRDATAG